MDFRELPALVLMFLFTGMLIGVGVLILSSFGDATSKAEVVTNESFTVPAVGASVSLSHGNLTVFTKILNATGSAQDTNNYTVTLATGSILHEVNTSTCTQSDTCYAYYTYTDYETNTKVALASAYAAVAGVATNWFALIITIAVLAILLTLVIRSFRGGR